MLVILSFERKSDILSRKDFWLKLFKTATTWESPRPTLKLKCSSYLVKVIFASPEKNERVRHTFSLHRNKSRHPGAIGARRIQF